MGIEDMTGETDLAALLRGLEPVRRPGEFVYVLLPPGGGQDLPCLATVEEPEGRCAVISRDDADRLGLGYDYVAAWITLQVHSSLAAVGLTAAFSDALASDGIGCNVIAGLHHDHVLVAESDADRALAALKRLSTQPPSRSSAGGAPVAER